MARQYKFDYVMVNMDAYNILDKVWAMDELGLPMCCVETFDDSSNSRETFESLKDYIDNSGGCCVKLDIENEIVNEFSPGTYLFYFEV